MMQIKNTNELLSKREKQKNIQTAKTIPLETKKPMLSSLVPKKESTSEKDIKKTRSTAAQSTQIPVAKKIVPIVIGGRIRADVLSEESGEYTKPICIL
ncbi:hypothetical protein NERG_01490 [Nematocida ausubeli]|uniref:Uncharacterized protein n=1 Tax=Nematocida ausubeli (strain ATCC PRA-371 / ERTm2) TaxID=1913371 RepID=H8ZCP7_NEMA1|nr:hypothetical protein NERG_01490 [Nematocida ausubeli]